MEKPIRVLQLTIGGTDFTGICSFMYTYYKAIDRNKIHYDFVFCRQNSMKLVMNDPIFDDSRFFEINAVNEKNEMDYKEFSRSLDKILKNGSYDIFHINTHRVGVSLIATLVAKRNKIKTKIAHSHNSKEATTNRMSIKSLLIRIGINIIRHENDYLFACSKEAGEALFGKTGVNQKNFYVVKNAIESKEYIYNESIRKSVRMAENADDECYVVGQVGRLSTQKNQIFTLSVFREIVNHYSNAVLWLIGTGDDLEKLKEVAVQLKIQDKVRFMGERQDVSSLMQAMDALVFPSNWEGLGIVAIEAQAAGLKTYASTAVPVETKITDLFTYLPLSEKPQKWADTMLCDLNNYSRENRQEEIIRSGYDIKEAAKWLENIYSHC